MNISFVGGGVMAEAIIGGILDANIASHGNIRVGEPSEKRQAHLANTYGLAIHSRNQEVVDNADIIILSVKPQSLSEVMADIKPALKGNQAVLSIVAGAKTETLSTGLDHASIIRVMPNTPAQIGAGMTVWTALPAVPKDTITTSRNILSTLGEELFVQDEKLIDMATALSASGPAYVFLFIETLIDAGVYLGLHRDVSRQLVLQTVQGSTKLVNQSGKHPAELKDMVSSPGGGTVEALMALEQAGFRGAILEGVTAAYEKYRTLGEQD